MYLLTILMPLLGSVFAGLFGRALGRKGSVVITTSFLFFTFLACLFAFYEVSLYQCVCSVKIGHWFRSEMFDCSWGFYFDSLTVVMLLVITSVSCLVHIYSASYMWEDPHLPRFMSYLSIFTFFMLMLVTGDNLLILFFGWEGVGLSSYLLINFWFTRVSANKASIKAMLVNRIGDFGLALGIMASFAVFKSVSLPVLFALAPSMCNQEIVFFNHSFHALSVITICLFVGAVGKSAQLGLHTWLPDAMEGPTPVSALIHAATMVTAGVFMIARCSPLFEFAPSTLNGIAVLGAMTCFFAATTALVQNDLKRVIAYSTASQLGYMIFACGVSSYSVAVFHLMNHAFFKALLFLSAGAVIHAVANQQDMRKMGGLATLLPFTYAMILIGSLSLAGFPFLTGFYSKDVILEVAFAKYTISGNFAALFGGICVLLTSYYSFRLCFLTFFTENKTKQSQVQEIHDAPFLMAFPLLLLALGSIFVGYCCKDMMIGVGTPFWGNSIFTLKETSNFIESEWLPQSIKLFPFCFTLIGLAIAGLTFSVHFTFASNISNFISQTKYSLKTSVFGRAFVWMLSKRWFFDKVGNDVFAEKALNFGYTTSFKNLDKGIFELFGPQGICMFFSKATRAAAGLQTGLIYHYVFMIIVGLTIFISMVNLWDVVFLKMLDDRVSFGFFVAFLLSMSYVSTVSLSLFGAKNVPKPSLNFR